MSKRTDPRFPVDHEDETDLLLDWLGFLRGAVRRNVEGIGDDDAHHRPRGRLLPLAGIVNHLVGVERRWIDGRMLGGPIVQLESEHFPGADVTVDGILAAYAERAAATDAVVRSRPLDARASDGGVSLRWILLHLINETARHAGHADAVRELIDGSTGE